MILVEHRHNLGFRDAFEGYVFLKDSIPFAQLHLYEDYHTFFWLGAAGPKDLGECLGETVREVTNQFGLSFVSMNTGKFCISRGSSIEKFSFAIEETDSDLVPRVTVGDTGVYLESFLSARTSIAFARFDVDSSDRMPLILWADAAKSHQSEVGFSSLIDLPSPVLTLLVSTCNVELSAEELNDISGQVSQRIPVGSVA